MSPSNPPTAQNPEAGFTLIELLIAGALGIVVTGVMVSLIGGVGTMQQRNSAQLSVDDAMRSSLELMSMDLREATITRVLSTTAPAALSAWYTSGSALTVTRVPPEKTFAIAKPTGYPVTKTYVTPTSTPLITPNPSGTACTAAFTSGDYGLATNGTQTQWVDVASCASGGTLNHPNTALWSGLGFTWTPTATVGDVTFTRYWVDTTAKTLLRQERNSTAQVVAYNVTGLAVEYTTDGTNWTSASAAAPRSVRMTLTGTRTVGTQTSDLSVSNTVFMRDLAIPAPPVTP